MNLLTSALIHIFIMVIVMRQAEMRVIAALFIVFSTQQAFGLTYDTFTDRGSWSAATGPTTQEDFNSEATGVFSPSRSFAGFTVVNTDPSQVTTEINGGSNSSNINGSNYLLYSSRDFGIPMIITFNGEISSLGFDWNNTDGSADVAQLTVIVDGQSFIIGGPGAGFFGIIATDGGFDSIGIEDTDGNGGILDSFGMDDIAWGGAVKASPATPVPTLSIWGLGILAGVLGLIGMRRRIK